MLTSAERPTDKSNPANSASIFSAVDEALDKLQIGNIAFNSPSPMNVDDSARVELRLDLRLPPAALVKTISARGVVEYATIKVSDRMTAHLHGEEFAITANTPETQAVSSREPTSWLWMVKPKTVGQCELCLNLIAIVDIDGSRQERNIETFSRTIHVIVTPGQRVKKFVKEHWKWLSGTILIPLVGWWWNQRH
ncbi:ornithine cyclodeaminase (plasmid) [Paraburkholderia caribensis MBA4]|uniref:Ornithine cyclodeaminase n=1 Tax=Paraburkholderia caribensis MBA4 TaxID=1323664 RepID=A0A0N7JVX6_9BURK|nr:ornithine cyclodeaminase [Paraburkholderia caribensis MBA4]